jgi:hypothetical protein
MGELTVGLHDFEALASTVGSATDSVNGDVIAALQAAGACFSGEDVKQWLSLAGASDAELVEVLRARIVKATLDDDAGCGCSCAYPDA